METSLLFPLSLSCHSLFSPSSSDLGKRSPARPTRTRPHKIRSNLAQNVRAFLINDYLDHTRVAYIIGVLNKLTVLSSIKHNGLCRTLIIRPSSPRHRSTRQVLLLEIIISAYRTLTDIVSAKYDSNDRIYQVNRGGVSVINHNKRISEPMAPRSIDAIGTGYYRQTLVLRDTMIASICHNLEHDMGRWIFWDMIWIDICSEALYLERFVDLLFLIGIRRSLEALLHTWTSQHTESGILSTVFF